MERHANLDTSQRPLEASQHFTEGRTTLLHAEFYAPSAAGREF